MAEEKSNDISEIIDVIKNHENILILTHVKPDGDAVGSVFALASALKKIDKNASILFDEYNKKFNLIATQKFDSYINKDNIDLIIVLDCGAKNRLGKHEYLLDEKNKVKVNIDHHISNDYFCDYNYVDAGASSTSEIIYEFIKKMDLLDDKIAAAIYAGIISDTGGFCHSCTSCKTHLIASELLKFKFDFSNIYNKLMLEKSLDEVYLLDYVIKNLEIIKNLGLAISYLKIEELDKVNNKFTGGLISFIKNICDIEIAVMIIENIDETGERFCKISFRSRETDVNEIAKKIGGGGHKNAAGANIKASIKNAKEKIISLISEKKNV